MADSENKFYKELEKVFMGEDIDGKGGFVRLMRIKSKYYSQIEQQIRIDISQEIQDHRDFREDLYTKLYSFFSKYFTQNGSICFNDTPFHNNIYEQVYDNQQDVSLFWKTRMLYYIKTERLYEKLTVEVNNYKFTFDCKDLEGKKTNEKQNIIFEFGKVDGEEITLLVKKGTNGTKTKEDEIFKQLDKTDLNIREEQLTKAIRLFEKKAEADFFINKDAKSFLEEQFKLWIYQYFWDGSTDWSEDRVKELQILRKIAFNIIGFIAQFEDELVKIWNKPKFAINSNYVITMDRLSDRLKDKVKKSKGYKNQLKEWSDFGIDPDGSKAPIDTKFFKELELEIIGQYDHLDEALDGRLIHSENYQALNTILPKFKEKVQCVYIDPPFNTGSDFSYMDKFQDSTWCTLMYDRISLVRELLNNQGSFYLHLDQNSEHYGRVISENIFGINKFRNQIIWSYGKMSNATKNYSQNHDAILFFTKSDDYLFKPMKKEESEYKNRWQNFLEDNKIYYRSIKGKEDKMLQDRINKIEKENGRSILDDDIIYDFDKEYKLLDNNWYIPILKGNALEKTDYNTQKPIAITERIISVNSKHNDVVLDAFAGSGTTTVAAHKHGRRWLGVEMSEEAIDVILKRKKVLLSGLKNDLSDEDNCGYKGGGFFKYYALEQYEDTLRNTSYSKDGELFTNTDSSIYEQYVFLPDEKMLKAIEVDDKGNSTGVKLENIFAKDKKEGKNMEIDIAETLSNFLGKPIKKITKDKLILEDGVNDTEIDLNNLNPHLVKPLIWWE